MDVSAVIYRDDFSEYFRDSDINAFVLRWLPTSKSMSENQFRGDLERLAEFLEHNHSPNVLIDVVNFQHKSPPDFADWRERNIIPRYNEAGVKKFAFLFPIEVSNTVENGTAPAVEGCAKFPTGYFNSREGVINWFRT